MNRARDLQFLLALAAATFLAAGLDAKEPASSRWEASIAAFEAQDQKQAPPKNAILFVGSSSIRLWDLEESFPDLAVINRGFGGSEVADSLHFADRIILPHRPRIVVVYAGDNDVAKGKTAKRVFADYQALVKRVNADLPKTKIVYIAIKPSIKRWKMVDEMRAANRLIRDLTENNERLEFVDIDTPMLNDEGVPRPELFMPDGLHLNAKGYELWTSLVLPHLRN